MKRDIVKIDESLCNGCGECIPNCHEGALRIIDDKARLLSDLMCDGLGACIGHCPLGAISIEKREAKPYNETEVMKEMVKKGKNTIIAHLKHLKDHEEFEFLKEGVNYLKENEDNLDFNADEIIAEVHSDEKQESSCATGGCPGSQAVNFAPVQTEIPNNTEIKSQLTQWPVQMHLINPEASYFNNEDILIAADCTAFSYGNFHNDFIKNKKTIIACPKLDSGLDIYKEKIIRMINKANINTITVVMMEVPCCGGLQQLITNAVQESGKKVPVKAIVISVKGEKLSEEWI